MTTTKTDTRITVEDATEILNNNIQQLVEGDNYQEMLKVMSHMRNYSNRNQQLIAAQRPNARMVMGYGDWKKIGRQVIKGETGIKILVPLVKKFEEEKKDKKTGQPILVNGQPVKEEKRGIAGFKTASVFDISQTEGKDILTPRQVIAKSLEEDENMSKLYEDYKAFLNENKLPVTEAPAQQNEYGYYHVEQHKIVISNDIEGLTDSRKFKTLIHEYAHATLHGKGAEFSNVGRSYAEVQAESVAFVVSHYYGLDTGDVSNGYVANWGKDPDLIQQALNEIHDVSNDIIEEINELQKETVLEAVGEANQDYENTKTYLTETVGLKKEIFEPEHAGTTSLQLIQKENGFIASAKLEYNEKNDSWYIRTNRNINEPLSEIGEKGKFAVLNVEQELNEVKSYQSYARIPTHYSVQEVRQGVYVVQLSAGQDKYKTSVGIEKTKQQPSRKDSPIISKEFTKKADAQEFHRRSSMGQALQEEMVTTKQLKNSSRQRELEFTLSEIRKNIASQVSSYVGHHTQRSVSFSSEGSTKVGWAILRHPNVKSLDDLEKLAKEKSGLVLGKSLRKALNESKVSDLEKEQVVKKPKPTQEIEREIKR